jgi:hypothetical protein
MEDDGAVNGINGIDESVRLSVKVGESSVLEGSLVFLALIGRAGNGDLLPFVYRDPMDPDNPNEERPLRRARLVIVEDGPVPEEACE